LAVFLLDTGGRYGEGAGVPWDVCDLSKRSINLYRDKVGNEGEIRMTVRLHEALLRRWNTRDPQNPYIFAAGISGPRGAAAAKDQARGYAVSGIRRALERAGLNAKHLVARFGKATPAHTLRHTFASRLVQAGMSLQKVAYLLGHADVSTTQIYAHLVPSDTAAEAAAILDALAQRVVPAGG
jgi:integrase